MDKVNVEEVVREIHRCLSRGASLNRALQTALTKSDNEWLRIAAKYKKRAESAERELEVMRKMCKVGT